MPRIPADIEKCRTLTEKAKMDRAALTERDEAALAELRNAVAKEMGADPDKLTMIVCRRGKR